MAAGSASRPKQNRQRHVRASSSRFDAADVSLFGAYVANIATMMAGRGVTA